MYNSQYPAPNPGTNNQVYANQYPAQPYTQTQTQTQVPAQPNMTASQRRMSNHLLFPSRKIKQMKQENSVQTEEQPPAFFENTIHCCTLGPPSKNCSCGPIIQKNRIIIGEGQAVLMREHGDCGICSGYDDRSFAFIQDVTSIETYYPYQRNIILVYILLIFFGALGIHRLYCNRIKSGLAFFILFITGLALKYVELVNEGGQVNNNADGTLYYVLSTIAFVFVGMALLYDLIFIPTWIYTGILHVGVPGSKPDWFTLEMSSNIEQLDNIKTAIQAQQGLVKQHIV